MSPQNKALRLLILSQLFTLFFLLVYPTVIRLLPQAAGRLLYGLLALGAIGFALALHHALRAIESAK